MAPSVLYFTLLTWLLIKKAANRKDDYYGDINWRYYHYSQPLTLTRICNPRTLMSALLSTEWYYNSRAAPNPVLVAMSYTICGERSCGVCVKWINTLGEYRVRSAQLPLLPLQTIPDCFTCHAGRQQDLKFSLLCLKTWRVRSRLENVLVPDFSGFPTAPCGCPRGRSLDYTRI